MSEKKNEVIEVVGTEEAKVEVQPTACEKVKGFFSKNGKKILKGLAIAGGGLLIYSLGKRAGSSEDCYDVEELEDETSEDEESESNEE